MGMSSVALGAKVEDSRFKVGQARMKMFHAAADRASFSSQDSFSCDLAQRNTLGTRNENCDGISWTAVSLSSHHGFESA
jgi:copper oxidase (laccase) domain-containing protein